MVLSLMLILNCTILVYKSLYVTAFSKGWLSRKLWVLVCLECREENRPFSGKQHQAQFGLNPALRPPYWISVKTLFLNTGSLGLPILHHCTKFGAKMLINAEIMAKNDQNRNPRWRLSVHRPVKYYANPMYSFEDMTIWNFCRFVLKCLFTLQKFWFWGVWTPKRDWSSSRPPKGTSLTETALTCQFWCKSVHWCDLCVRRRNQKRRGKKLLPAPFPHRLWPVAYITTCTTVQAVIISQSLSLARYRLLTVLSHKKPVDRSSRLLVIERR